jgi:hypothetical protein
LQTHPVSAEAIAILLERERALPASYNPPAYLARLYRDSGQWEAGLQAIERALARPTVRAASVCSGSKRISSRALGAVTKLARC